MQDEEKPILILFILTMKFQLTDSKCSLDSNFISVACVTEQICPLDNTFPVLYIFSLQRNG